MKGLVYFILELKRAWSVLHIFWAYSLDDPSQLRIHCSIKLPHSPTTFAYHIRLPHSHATFTCHTHLPYSLDPLYQVNELSPCRLNTKKLIDLTRRRPVGSARRLTFRPDQQRISLHHLKEPIWYDRIPVPVAWIGATEIQILALHAYVWTQGTKFDM